MHVVYVQYGDYAEAYHRFERGGPETYQAQRHTVKWVQEKSREHQTTVVCLNAPPSDETLEDGRIRAISRRLYDETPVSELVSLVASLRPDAVILRTPIREMADWCRRRDVPCLPMFADLVSGRSVRDRVWCWRLARVLKSRHFPCVSNHNLNASRWLREIGLPEERIIAWDYPMLLTPGPAKQRPANGEFRLFFAGATTVAKGVGDIIDALALLRSGESGFSLTVAGMGEDLESLRARAASAGVRAEFLGLVPFERVGALMRDHDAVIVPSRHAYHEGLPNTIFEGLASGSPIVVSDHPSFRGRILDAETGLVFRASDPASLAASLARLRGDAELYQRLSARGARSYRELFMGMEWSELIERFLNDPDDSTGWVAPASLAAVERRLRDQARAESSSSRSRHAAT